VKVRTLRSKRRGSCKTFWITLACAGWSLNASAQAESAASVSAACVAHAERAQEFYVAGDVVQARAEVSLCAQAHCPALVRGDCESWLAEWEQPVVSSGTESGEGTAASQPSGDSSESTVRPAPVNTASTPKAPSPVTATRYENNQRPIWPWLATAVGVVSTVGFAYWGLNGRREAEMLADRCGYNRSCRQSEVDPVREKLILADVSLGAGLLAFGAAIWGFAANSSATQPQLEATNTRRQHPLNPSRPVIGVRGSSFTARFVF
jgi:hypothetical protein